MNRYYFFHATIKSKYNNTEVNKYIKRRRKLGKINESDLKRNETKNNPLQSIDYIVTIPETKDDTINILGFNVSNEHFSHFRLTLSLSLFRIK